MKTTRKVNYSVEHTNYGKWRAWGGYDKRPTKDEMAQIKQDIRVSFPKAKIRLAQWTVVETVTKRIIR